MDQIRIAPAAEVLETPLETVQVLELETGSEASGDWITRVLSSGLFRHMTPEHSHRFFAELEPVSVRAGQVVVEQGAQGQHLYIVTQGRCAVTRQVPSSNREMQLNVLREGDTFGEGPLISGTPRMTTVRMLNDGTLMRLERSRFEQLVAAPMLSRVGFDEASRLVDEGAVWLDVRQHAGHLEDAFAGSVNVPAHVLSIEAAKLDRAATYVVYCDDGAHSATGAFLLTRLGFEAHVLDGGLTGMRSGDAGDQTVAAGQPQHPDSGAEQPLQVSKDSAGVASSDIQAPREDVESLSGAPALDAAEQAEGRARILARHNAALMRLIRIQRDRHQAAAQQFEAERGVMATALGDVEARLEGAVERLAAVERERAQVERLCTQTDARLVDTGEQLGEARTRLAESDARLSQTLGILAAANDRLAATTVKLFETNEKLAGAEARLALLEHQLTMNMAGPREDDGAAEVRAKLAAVDAELAHAQARLAEALSDNAREHAARQRAESALEVALAELHSHVEGLASLRFALTDETRD